MALKGKKGGKGDGEMSFLEHLEELRWHIIPSLLAVVILMIVAFCFKNVLLDQLEENNEAINDMKIAFDSLSKGNSEGSAIALLDSLSVAFDKCCWEDTPK